MLPHYFQYNLKTNPTFMYPVEYMNVDSVLYAEHREHIVYAHVFYEYMSYRIALYISLSEEQREL